MTAVLPKQELTRPETLMNKLVPLEYQTPDAAFADLHEHNIFGTKDKVENDEKRALTEIKNFTMREEIEKAMLENFKHEQNTIENLFRRYQQYKPLVSGLYGQDVVQEGVDEPTNLKQIQVEKWLQTMKDNHSKTKVNLSEKYSEIPETCGRFSGVIKEGAIDLAETPTGKPHF